MRRITLGRNARLTALALMVCALSMVGCNLGPGTKMKKPQDTTPDPSAGIEWRLVRTGGGLPSPVGTAAEDLRGVAWGAGRFVAVGNRGTIGYSADGVTWTEARATASDERLVDVAWGGGRFVAISSEGMVVNSADGASWKSAAQRAITDGWLSAITYDGARFVAVGGEGTIAVQH